MTKEIAKTLQEIPHNPLVKAALSRSRPLEDLIDEYLEGWQANLEERKPALIYTETDSGEPLYKTGSLDLFTVLLALAENEQVISIDNYHRMRESQTMEGQRIIDPDHRHGQVTGIISNKEVGSFSVRLWDLSVETTLPDGTTERGYWRNFALVDVYGRTRPEWESGTVTINTTPEQVEYFKSRGMEILSAPIEFENFVHPQLYKCPFGQRYAIGKILAECVPIEREYWKGIEKTVSSLLADQGVDLKAENKRRRAEEKMRNKEPSGARHYGSKGEKVLVPALEGKLTFPMKSGEYPWYARDEFDDEGENLRLLEQEYGTLSTDDLKDLGWYIYKQKVKLSFTLGPKIRAPLRAAELALYLKLTDGEDLETLAMDKERLAACQDRLAEIAKSVGWSVPVPEPGQFVEGEGPYHAFSYDNGFTLHYRLHSPETKIVKTPKPE